MTIKLCRTCFVAMYPGAKETTVTWGRQCSACHKPTPPLTTLVKIGD